jgi:branched-chain amino acid aminotransferase|tara:strand:+ start:135 stop:1061 length:927 start_codon:yes stop_codon:yes gene_type:complete
MTTPKYASINGEIIAWENANVHVASAGFKFGTAVFEGLRGYWNSDDEEMYLFRMQEHMQRFEFSQRFMRFDKIFSGETVTQTTVKLIHANKFKGENLHIMTTAYVEGMGGPGVCGPIGLSITAQERPRSDRVLGGVTAQVSSWMRVPDNAMPMRVKCNANYNNGRLATVQAEADGYDTAIFLNSRGKVSEGPGMCLFIIRDGIPITPSISNDILESVTRDSVLKIIEQTYGKKPIERDIDRSELVAAEEAFFCGTAWEITPILSIDRIKIGTGQIGMMTKQLQDKFFFISEGRDTQYSNWCHPVYKTD